MLCQHDGRRDTVHPFNWVTMSVCLVLSRIHHNFLSYSCHEFVHIRRGWFNDAGAIVRVYDNPSCNYLTFKDMDKLCPYLATNHDIVGIILMTHIVIMRVSWMWYFEIRQHCMQISSNFICTRWTPCNTIFYAANIFPVEWSAMRWAWKP